MVDAFDSLYDTLRLAIQDAISPSPYRTFSKDLSYAPYVRKLLTNVLTSTARCAWQS